jgi:DNA-binding GntR family transcriptional regulator
MTVKEYVAQVVDSLSEAELQQVAEYLAFLKFRARVYAAPHFDATQAAALYAEFAEEDRAIAESGMAEYNVGLDAEDSL